VLRLTLLAPDIVEAILDGRQPAELQLDSLMKRLQVEWEAQRSVVARSLGLVVRALTVPSTDSPIAIV